MRQKILHLFDEVEKIDKSSSKAAGESNLAANEASRGLSASYSAAGDVEHARNSANLSIQKAEQINKLTKELEKSQESEVPTTIRPVCFVSVKFKEGNQKDLYFVENPVYISGYNLISADSPLGKSLLGKGIGDRFFYTSGNQKFEGNVLEIE